MKNNVSLLPENHASGPGLPVRQGAIHGAALGSLCLAILRYAVAAALAIALLVCVMRLWHADLSVPFIYQGDGLWGAVLIKGTIEHGWYLHNSNVGAPTGLDMSDFPMAEAVHFLLIKLMGWFITDFGLLCNSLVLLGFPLTTLTALFVLGRFGIAYGPALVASVLFAFLPYHFFRAFCHVFLASYFMVPLIVMVILWVYLGQGIFVQRNQNKTELRFLSRKAIASIVICILISSTGIYYAFFACWFLLLAGVAGSVNCKKLSPLWTAVLLVTVIFLGVLANVAPTILGNWQQGPNPEVARRSAGEAETFGLKIVQLLLPPLCHQLACFRDLAAKYSANAPLVNENQLVSLGAVGSLGFVIMIGQLFCPRPVAGAGSLRDCLSRLNLAAVLLGTIGGFGSAFALFISPEIRGYNRIGIYIGFFALFTMALVGDWLIRRHPYSMRGRALLYLLLALVLGGGVLDQSFPLYKAVWYQARKQQYKNDAAFVQAVEAVVPEGAMIFQLPYMSFPEGIQYDPFIGYIHSKRLRWSFGAMKSRPGDLWVRNVAQQPLSEMVDTLATAGFSGIWLDTRAFADGGVASQTQLAGLTGAPPLVSSDGRWAFFNLSRYGQDRTPFSRESKTSVVDE